MKLIVRYGSPEAFLADFLKRASARSLELLRRAGLK